MQHGATLVEKFLNHFKCRFGFKSPLSHSIRHVPSANAPTAAHGQPGAEPLASDAVVRGTQPRRRYTVDDYFAVETDSSIKHEFHRGEIFAMAGASLAHNHVSANILALLRLGLRGSGCNAFGSDLRLRTPGGLFTYPDVSVICGDVELFPGRPDTVTNPVLLVEVLSQATRDYDRGEKFALYKEIATLREYLLVDPDSVRVEQWRLGRGRRWIVKAHERLDGAVEFASVPATLAVAEIYREVVKDMRRDLRRSR